MKNIPTKIKSINEYQKIEYPNIHILLKAENNMVAGKITLHNHSANIVNETEDYYEVTQAPIYRIPKEDAILDDEEANFTVLKFRLENDMGVSSKHRQDQELMTRAQKEMPQYFI